MTYYVFLMRRAQDKQSWPVIYFDRELAESSPFRVSEIKEVDLQPTSGRRLHDDETLDQEESAHDL